MFDPASRAPGASMFRLTRRPPLTAFALALALGLAACGGDAESAADADSTPLAEEMDEAWGEDGALPEEAGAAPAPVAPATPAPAPRVPATPPPPPAPPASGPPAPPSPEQPPEPEAVPEPVGATLPAGTQLTATLETTLSTRTNRAGETFHARISEALRASDGSVILPAGSRLEGRVVESRESPSAEEPAALLLEIQALVVEGTRYPIQATVLETQVSTEARDSAQRQVATVATGAAAGAVVGRILGRDTRSAVAGAAAGAAAGAGIALTTRDGHATLPEGSTIRIRLEGPVVVADRR